MAVERFHVQQKNVGLAVGIIVGMFGVARFFSSTIFGHLSDKWGRRTFLIIGLIVSMIGTAGFGFLDSVYLAVGIRCLEGFLSATSALCRSILVDISDSGNRALYFGYLGASYAMSRSLSSALGGLAVAAFSEWHNPYLPACLIGAFIVGAAGILAFALPETNKAVVQRRRNVLVSDEMEQEGRGNAHPGKRKDEHTFIEGMKTIFLDKLVCYLTLIYCINSFGNGAMPVVM